MSARRTLRFRLVLELFIPLALVCAVGAILAKVTVQRAIGAAYDRSLAASALEISEHVRMAGSVPEVDLPPVALEMLDTADQDRLYYSVSYRAPGGRDVFMTGYDDLPRAPDVPAGKSIFHDATYRGERVRIAAHFTAMPGDPPVMVVTQVAETVGGRRSLIFAILGHTLAQQIVLVLVGAGIVWLGVTRGLRPLRALSAEVAQRTATDLEPLRHVDVPEEISPLVDAVDELMARVRESIALQRRFVADASHQLRTPLAVLRTQAESALREDDPAAIRSALARLRDHSVATSHLAGQLLSLARAEPSADALARLEQVDLVAIAREACGAMVPEAIARGADLGFEGEGPVPVRAQRLMVRELIANLVDNSLRYAPKGTVTVRVAPGANGGAVLSVEDDGPGIPEAERDKVLGRFYRIPGSPGDGAGLGLAIVQEIARGHQAKVLLAPGQGGKGLRVEVPFPPSAAG